MRTQVDREAMRTIRALEGDEGRAVRRRIESLEDDPHPQDAIEIPSRPGRYEIFEAGYWIIYQVDQSNPSETVISILLVEAN